MSQRLRRKWVVLLAVMIHGWWGVLLLWDPASVRAITAVATTVAILGSSWLTAGLYLLASALTLWSMRHWWYNRRLRFFCCLPQQFLLMLSAGGALLAMWSSQFADGVARPWAFIAADQSPAVFVAICHTAALWEVFLAQE